MTLRRDRKRGQKQYRRTAASIRIEGLNARQCMNGCGEPGPHFVPPSFGDPGFFTCTPLPTAEDPQ